MIMAVRALTPADVMDAALMIAEAFTDRAGQVPDRYRPEAVLPALRWSLEAMPHLAAPRYLVAEVDGRIGGIGGYARSRSAAETWELLLAATRPDLQGRGIGHTLMLARWEAIRDEAPDGGLVQVSTKSPARFLRYGFQRGPVNPSTGAVQMWAVVPASGRAAA